MAKKKRGEPTGTGLPEGYVKAWCLRCKTAHVCPADWLPGLRNYWRTHGLPQTQCYRCRLETQPKE